MLTFLDRTLGAFRVRFLCALIVTLLIFNTTLRIALHIAFPEQLPFSVSMGPGLLAGIVNDFATLIFTLLPAAALILLPGTRFLRTRIGRAYAACILFLYLALFLFAGVAEFYFWDEFKSRFNFIAVDYLIYTTELADNMLESYPLYRLLAGIGLAAILLSALLWTRLRRFLQPDLSKSTTQAATGTLRGRLAACMALYAMAACTLMAFTPIGGATDRYWAEFAKNGVYELFSAYFHNQLDYRAFYRTIDTQEAFNLTRQQTAAPQDYLGQTQANLVRQVVNHNTTQPVKPNVVLVIMESMGSNWMGEYTPNLNELADAGLNFTRMMSTGTRTVRGIEAIMLSVPPTPGNSIVRRPDNDRLFNLGTLFHEQGYDTDFIYGGLGYFDNMNAFFAGNGYTVTDKLNFTPGNKTFANAWGQCDEDLYAESLRLADKSYANGTPFQQVLLTTSNHRPFTFPEQTIDMPPYSRRAAVKYADYAIGKFMDQAREKPWFDNTIFLFVGDHPSSIAGKTEVPADGYGIVCIMYGPKFFPAETVSTLCSQIDVAPTLFAALGWDYVSQFFGTDARTLPPQDGRAWISTYQLLGLRTNDALVLLKPNKETTVEYLATQASGTEAFLAKDDQALMQRAVASYQCAYDLFTSHAMKESMVLAATPRLRATREPRPGKAQSLHTNRPPRKTLMPSLPNILPLMLLTRSIQP